MSRPITFSPLTELPRLCNCPVSLCRVAFRCLPDLTLHRKYTPFILIVQGTVSLFPQFSVAGGMMAKQNLFYSIITR